MMAGVTNFNDGTLRTNYPRDNDLGQMNGTTQTGTIAVNTEYTYQVVWNAETQTTNLRMFYSDGTRFINDTVTNTSTSVPAALQNRTAAFSPAFYFTDNTVKITEMSVETGIPIDVTAVSIPATLELPIGESDTLTVSYTPENSTFKGVTWTSSDPAVATVNKYSGQIRALNAGQTTITATSAIGRKTSTCIVTVQ